MVGQMDDESHGKALAEAARQGLADAIAHDPSLQGRVEPAIVNALLAVYHELRNNSRIAVNAIDIAAEDNVRDDEDPMLKAIRQLSGTMTDHARVLGWLQQEIGRLREDLDRKFPG